MPIRRRISSESRLAAANFLSFFTIQSNVVPVAALFSSCSFPVSGGLPVFDGVRSAAVLCIAITGGRLRAPARRAAGRPADDQRLGRLRRATSSCRSSSRSTGCSIRRGTGCRGGPCSRGSLTRLRGSRTRSCAAQSSTGTRTRFVDVSELGYGGVLGRTSVLTIGGFALGAAALLWLGNRRVR